MLISEIQHPIYTRDISFWMKWRLAYEGGYNFIKEYLKQLSKRESEADYAARLELTYCPGFAAAAINEIKNSIYQRMVDVRRIDGPNSYLESCKGNLGGVDLTGSSMNSFMGVQVLLEMLVMKKVGVLIDAPANIGSSLLEKGNKHPYLGVYTTESIRSWTYYTEENTKILKSVLLEEEFEDLDVETGLTKGMCTQHRLMQLTPEGVVVTFYRENTKVNQVILDLKRIPFVIFEIDESLMKNVADYQVALMNLESADIAYAIKSNFALYYEFFDSKSEQIYSKPATTGADGKTSPSSDKEVKIGTTYGRRFPKDMPPPGFINPDPDTLRASMEKGNQLKNDIRQLVNLNLIEAAKQKQSADSKQHDQLSLDSSLSLLGLILQKGESEIAALWSAFEGSNDISKVVYPNNYSLKSEIDRINEANELKDLMSYVPSKTYKRSVAKEIARVTVGHKVSESDLTKILNEVETAKTLTSNPDEIIADHEAGLVSDETASAARGYPAGEVEQARKDRAERIKLTMEAQGGPQAANPARGASDFIGTTSSQEKQGKQKRGTADVISNK